MRERESHVTESDSTGISSHTSMGTVSFADKASVNGVASLWQDVVDRLEKSVGSDLLSDDPKYTLKSIKSLRQFAVASAMNKTVIGKSSVLRPRLLELLSRFGWWSTRRLDVCIDLCALVNSLVRDCSTLTESVLSHPGILSELMEVILNKKSEPCLRESSLLLLRSLFGAEEVSSVLTQPTQVPSRHSAATNLFTESILRVLLEFIRSSSPETPTTDLSLLTNNARCWLLELLALLATDSELAARLHRLGVIEVCHTVISSALCRHVNLPESLHLSARSNSVNSRVVCLTAADPTNQLSVRFTLKLLVHLFFHLDDALSAFKKVYGEDEPLKLISCYSHLTRAITSTIPNTFHQLSPGYRGRFVGDSEQENLATTKKLDHSTLLVNDPSDVHLSLNDNKYSNTVHIPVPVSSCIPIAHGTQVFLGLLRGLIYWRMVTEAHPRCVSAVDQFGGHPTSATGLGLTDDDIARLIIQPLTEGCLHVDDIRVMSWICHVLVLVLGERPELHLWTIYTNSFVREVNSRVTALIRAVQESSDCVNQIQFIEHLIPLIKLFTCLASKSEAIRVLFGEMSMCETLIDFALRLKTLGPEHSDLVLEFQHSVASLLQVLSRSFSAHHELFRLETVGHHLLQLVKENFSGACLGDSLSADVVDAASCVLVNILLPMSPPRESPQNSVIDYMDTFIQLIKAIDNPCQSSAPLPDTTSPHLPETTPDLRKHIILSPAKQQAILTIFRLNGIWGLANLLHCAPPDTCTDVFQRLVSNSVWVELLRPVPHVPYPNMESSPTTIDESTKTQVLGNKSSFSTAVNDKPFESISRGLNTQRIVEAKIFKSGTESDVKTENFDAKETVGSGADEQPLKTNDREFHIQILLIYHTLALLRNLLRDEKVIDLIVKDHWWNITQFIISVLEGNYPHPVKEQAVMVLAHIANGTTYREELHRNEDLVEKLKLFMRSSDSYLKAAALTATYNLLGLGRDSYGSPGIWGSLRSHSEPFLLSYQRRRVHHRHHHDKDKHGNKSELPCSSTSSRPSGRETVTCVAQSALEEAEEEIEEEEQDIVVEHATESAVSHSHMTFELATNESPEVPSLTVQDSSVQCTPLQDSSEPILPREHRHRSYRHQSPLMATTDERAETEPLRIEEDKTAREIYQSERLAIRSLSTSSSSSTSSTSYAEGEASPAAQLADLDQTTAQDICAISSPSASEGELMILSPTFQQSQEEAISNALTSSSRAPLACEERVDDSQSQTISVDLLSPDSAQAPTAVVDPTSSQQNASDPNVGLPGDRLKHSEENSTGENLAGDSSVPLSPHLHLLPRAHLPSSFRRSRRDWEAGFRQILLPFLQELESDQILRSTWDWLMLRANRRGKPIRLYQLFAAWQQFYNSIPPHNFPTSSFTDDPMLNDSTTVDAFLRKLKESSDISPSASFLASLSHHRNFRHLHRRRHHHHCHRHQVRDQTTDSEQHPESTPNTVDCTASASFVVSSSGVLEEVELGHESTAEGTTPANPDATT
ncbi:unnamed protein product [Calicophoron daubneyi]|uniref:Uncharacterized protein n=1 Tax=Calicophoron daubneyi TaxID=300641 RepID=A0AAV2U0I5_CALDB